MAYISGTPGEKEFPLDRFLPPIRSGVISTWLEANVPSGSWVIDPIGAHPLIALEAAKCGYSVLVTCNNPILAFLLELLAVAPDTDNFKAALADLSSQKRGEERLEQHLRSLYQTECADCRNTIDAEAFLWRSESKIPFARIYHCPHCGDEGERATTPLDYQRLDLCGNDLLHRSRAAERLCSKEDILRPSVEDALQVYPRRQLYFLSTLINRLEGMNISSFRRKLLTALLLSACDKGNTLHSLTSGRNRPRQLSVPPVFRENNLWFSLEESIPHWTIYDKPIPITRFPELPPTSGGICIFRGRLRSLNPQSFVESGKAALLCLPRPNQAFWILSAIWSSWLWGREAAQALRASLERQRYDWNWHTSALYNSLSPLCRWLSPGSSIFCLLAEITPGFLAAVLSATEAAGLHLHKCSFRLDQNMGQFHLITDPIPIAEPQKEFGKLCAQAMKEHLQKRGEPCDYLQLYAAAMSALAVNHALPQNSPAPPAGVYSLIQAAISESFNNPIYLKRFSSTSTDVERGVWWLAYEDEINPPLKDRIEIELVKLLQKKAPLSAETLDHELCRLFPGLFTPPMEFIDLCVESYAENYSQQAGWWQLKSQDTPANRKKELANIKDILIQMGKRLGYKVQSDNTFVWIEQDENPVYEFFLLASSIISRFVLDKNIRSHSTQKVLVFPGSRSRLITYKLKTDPRLREASTNWHFLKFRHLRNLYERDDLTRNNWTALLDSDPPFWNEISQMKIF